MDATEEPGHDGWGKGDGWENGDDGREDGAGQSHTAVMPRLVRGIHRRAGTDGGAKVSRVFCLQFPAGRPGANSSPVGQMAGWMPRASRGMTVGDMAVAVGQDDVPGATAAGGTPP